MIFYGTNSSKLKDGRISNTTCPNCETNSKMDYTIFGKYFYIYWIPIFPIGRVNIVECNHCKATYDIKNLDQNIKTIFQKEQERNPTKTPIKLFSGLIIGAIITVAIIGFGIKADNDSLEFAKNPKVGDVFCEVTLRGWYSSAKVVKVTKDSIFALENNMETDQKSSVDEIASKEENYTLSWPMTKKEYLEFATKADTIYKIDRK
ncbi:zinc-ribbon domain-containing protein [Flavobacterium sp.]|uniref:zinc-ribbon domain-containing protein n=1 Tax=Flavobacterium sp. TaxID=239 RepID=UPI00286B0EF8|nr:zinc-ribbon domain-containing protein [Flavobacterium sp.]